MNEQITEKAELIFMPSRIKVLLNGRQFKIINNPILRLVFSFVNENINEKDAYGNIFFLFISKNSKKKSLPLLIKRCNSVKINTTFFNLNDFSNSMLTRVREDFFKNTNFFVIEKESYDTKLSALFNEYMDLDKFDANFYMLYKNKLTIKDNFVSKPLILTKPIDFELKVFKIEELYYETGDKSNLHTRQKHYSIMLNFIQQDNISTIKFCLNNVKESIPVFIVNLLKKYQGNKRLFFVEEGVPQDTYNETYDYDKEILQEKIDRIYSKNINCIFSYGDIRKIIRLEKELQKLNIKKMIDIGTLLEQTDNSNKWLSIRVKVQKLREQINNFDFIFQTQVHKKCIAINKNLQDIYDFLLFFKKIEPLINKKSKQDFLSIKDFIIDNL